MESRTLVCLDTTGKSHLPHDLIAATGWQQLKADSIEQAAAYIRAKAANVGLVYIGESELNGQLSQFEQLLSQAQSLEWVGMIPPELLARTETQRLIANYFNDYHTLPTDKNRLLNSLGHAFGMADSRRAYLSHAAEPVNGYKMVAVSPAMLSIFRDIDKVASVDASVMVSGESGTGKELVAYAIHNESPRKDGPFIAVNCGAIAAGLIQSELFGHEKGAFSGAHKRHIGSIEAAHNGTIFLDEIGDLPLEQQVNLLRFLQDKKITRVGSNTPITIDVRVITATHRNLEQAITTGDFREDLYYRLHVLSLHLPPLRDRKEDIAPLAHYFLNKFHTHSKHKIRGVSSDALERMYAYHWPGNVRELINKIERAVVMSERELIEAEDLQLDPSLIAQKIPTLADARADAERQSIQLAMSCCQQSVTNSAKLLGVSRVTLYRLLQKLSLGQHQRQAGASVLNKYSP